MTSTNIRFVPTGGPLGADVWGVSLTDVDDALFARLHQAWLDFDGVLRFPAQDLTDEQFLAFAARFGTLDRSPQTKEGDLYRPDLPELLVISNIVKDGKALGGLGHYESKWHTDMSYNEIPPKASILYGIQIPAEGGDTGYCNMYQAYETLPAATKKRIANLTCKHDASRNSVGEVRAGCLEHYDNRADVPGAVHPLVARHPESGREALYLGRRALAFIPELDEAESDALLDELWEHASSPAFAWYQKWRVGDVVIWDNRCTMHRRDAFDSGLRRLLHRAQVQGERPVAAMAA